MAKTTPATLALKTAGISFELHEYDYDPDAEKIGLQAAESLGVSPSLVLKTLIVQVDARPCCVVLPSDREASMKKLAAAFGGKTAEMCKPGRRRTDHRLSHRRRKPARTEEAPGHDRRSHGAGPSSRLRERRPPRIAAQA